MTNIQERITEIDKTLAHLKEKRDSFEAKRQIEKDLISQVRSLKLQIESAKSEAEEAERRGELSKVAELRYGKILDLQKKIDTAKHRLDEEKSKGKTFIKEEITPEDISEIISKMTGIPINKVSTREQEKLLFIEDELHKRVVGQAEAIKLVSNAVKRARAGFSDLEKPIGTFIFLGTTGVGKTELAKSLAEYLFNNQDALIRIDMSEYMESHTVSKFIGAPPGYIGHEEGGQLTELVRRKPFSVILLDEIEKAHPDVLNILLQVMDNGRLTDSKGRTVNFKNTILIMTSNLGSDIIQQKLSGLDENDPEYQVAVASSKQEVFNLLQNRMRPEFLNRVDELIMFLPLNRSEIRQVVDIQFARIVEYAKQKQITLSISDEAKEWLSELGYSTTYGARPLKRVIQRRITNSLAEKVLSGKINEGDSVQISLKGTEFDFNITKSI